MDALFHQCVIIFDQVESKSLCQRGTGMGHNAQVQSTAIHLVTKCRVADSWRLARHKAADGRIGHRFHDGQAWFARCLADECCKFVACIVKHTLPFLHLVGRVKKLLTVVAKLVVVRLGKLPGPFPQSVDSRTTCLGLPAVLQVLITSKVCNDLVIRGLRLQKTLKQTSWLAPAIGAQLVLAGAVG